MSENYEDFKKLNPQITEIEVGTRYLRNVRIYPLSLGDEIRLTQLVEASLKDFFSEEKRTTVDFVSFLVSSIKNNLSEILTMTTDEKGEDIIKELSNIQFITVCEVIYKMNFEDNSKNAQDLLQKIVKLLPLRRSAQPSVNDTATNPMISSASPSEMAD